MRRKSVLRSTFIGYTYRGLRAVGLILTLAGLWSLATIVFHSLTGGKAIATISRLQVVCVLQGSGPIGQAFTKEVECSEAEAVRARYSGMPIAVGEISYGTFSFNDEDAKMHEVRAPLTALEADGAAHGKMVTIVYNRAEPAVISPALPLAAILKSLSLLSGGVALLFAMLTMHWIGTHRRGIEGDVAILEQNYTTEVRRSLRLPIKTAAEPANALPLRSITGRPK